MKPEKIRAREVKVLWKSYLEQVHDAFVILFGDLSGFNNFEDKDFTVPVESVGRYTDAINRARKTLDVAMANLDPRGKRG